MNYEKFEKNIIYVVKRYVKYMLTKKFFIQFMKNIKIKHQIFEKDIEKKIEQIDKAILDITITI